MIENRNFSIMDLMEEIKNGNIKLPRFQREYVWVKKDICKLFDSIIRRYPIGGFIFWNTNSDFYSIRNIGNFSLPDFESKNKTFIIDGQQRIKSIFFILNSLKIYKNNRITLNSDNIFIDLTLNNKDDNSLVSYNSNEFDCKKHIKINTLLYEKPSYLYENYSQYYEKISYYRDSIMNYMIPCITLKNTCISETVNIFSRLNSNGKPLSIIEIINAKTYDLDYGFDLNKKIIEFKNILNNEELYEIKSQHILTFLSLIVNNKIGRNAILNTDKFSLIDNFDISCENMLNALRLCKHQLGINKDIKIKTELVFIIVAYYLYKGGEDYDYISSKVEKILSGNKYDNSTQSSLMEDIKCLII